MFLYHLYVTDNNEHNINDQYFGCRTKSKYFDSKTNKHKLHFHNYLLTQSTQFDDLGETMFLTILTCEIIIILSLPFLFGGKMAGASSKLIDCAYQSNWLDGSMKFKKMLIIFMIYNMKETTFRINGKYDLNNQELYKVSL